MGNKQTDKQVERRPDFKKGDRVSGTLSVLSRTRRVKKDIMRPINYGVDFGSFNQEYERMIRKQQYRAASEWTTEETRESNIEFLFVQVPPYKVKGVWHMTVSSENTVEEEVKCKDFHLVGEREIAEPLLTKETKERIMKLSKPAIVTGAILVLGLMIFGWFTGNYNSLVKSKAEVDNSWAKVETQYQRRLDLIDNVVASVKGSQGQEQAVFGRIADARKQYSNAKTSDEKAAAASQVETTVAVLPRLQEAYPELKSNEQVTKLISELQGTENGIATVRNTYNDTVTNYNVGITSFPKNFFANMFGFEKSNLFKAASGADKAPTVKF